MAISVSLRAGDMRHVVDFESPTEGRSAAGAVTTAPWLPFASKVFCQIMNTTGNERYVAGEFLAQSTHVVLMRWLPGLTSKARINYKTDAQRVAGQDGRLFEILHVNDVDELHRHHVLTCIERTRGHGI